MPYGSTHPLYFHTGYGTGYGICIVIQWSIRSYFIESQWICRIPCRIPYENASRTGVRILPNNRLPFCPDSDAMIFLAASLCVSVPTRWRLSLLLLWLPRNAQLQNCRCCYFQTPSVVHCMNATASAQSPNF